MLHQFLNNYTDKFSYKQKQYQIESQIQTKIESIYDIENKFSISE